MLDTGQPRRAPMSFVLQRRWVVLGAALVVALAALIGVSALLGVPTREDGGAGQAAIGGPFRLTDQNGNRVSSGDFAGKYMLVYFGYTYCPDICPMTLSNMTTALDRLPPDLAQQVVPVFITVDPQRDTVEQLVEYAPLIHSDLVALTGTDAEIKAAARAYRVYFAKAEGGGEGDSYLMDHSSFIYLMGPDGKYVTHFGHNATPEEIAGALQKEIAAA